MSHHHGDTSERSRDNFLTNSHSKAEAFKSDAFAVPRPSVRKDEVTNRPSILIADGNTDTRQYMVRFLAEHYQVETVPDGEAALVAVEAHRPDLIVCDLMMPRLDGLGLRRVLRANPATKTIPLILLTARAGEESRIEGLQSGADEYLIKPFSAGELLVRVQAHLDLARLMREREEHTASDLEAMTQLHEIGNRCVRSGNGLTACLTDILDTAIRFTRADKGNLRVLDRATGTLTIHVHRGFEEPFLRFFAAVRTDEAASCAWAMRVRNRVIIEDIMLSELLVGQPSLTVFLEAGVRAMQSTPLVSSSGTVLGMISTHFTVPHIPTDRELRLLDLLARQTADYLERKQHEQALQHSAKELHLLYELATKVNRADELQSLYETTLDAMVTALNANRASILGFDEGGVMRFLAWRGLSQPYRDAVEGHSPWKVGDGDPSSIMIPDVASSDIAPSLKTTIHQEGIRALAFIPLTYAGRLIGKVMMYFDEPHVMNMDDLELAKGIANTLAVGIERKRDEDRLRKSEERFRVLVSVLTDVPWITDMSGALVEQQPAWQAYTGQTWDEYRGFGWLQAVHPDDRERVKALWAKACETKMPYEYRGRLWHSPTQHWRYYIGRGRPLFNRDGTVRDWVGAVTDVDEMTRMTKALGEKEERLRTALAAGQMGTWDMDLPTGTVTWDAKQHELFGVPPEQSPHDMEAFYALVHPDDMTRVKQAAAATESIGRFVEEFRIIRPNGHVGWISGQWAIVRDQSGCAIRIVGVNYDVTERKEAQFRLESFTDELERQVTIRTAELLDSQAQLRALATELNLAEQRERTRLATDLHDYLAQLLVLGRITLAQTRTPDLSPGLETVITKTQHILDKALNYCRTLMSELSPPVLRDGGLSQGLVWLANFMKEQDLEVTVDTTNTKDLSLPDDRVILLFQSVRELLINVTKHAAIKKAAVTMTDQDGLLKIIVHDENGFDLAAAAAADPSGASSKFGLYSIRERMKALGGGCEIISARGQGTTVTLTLPISDVQTTRGDKKEQASDICQSTISPTPGPLYATTSDQSSSLTHLGRTVQVLLVDDHTVLREGLRTIVSTYSHLQVAGEASNGEEAIELAQQLHPDVVVMDVNMPKVNGIEATKHIKDKQPDIIIIGLSVLNDAITEQRMREAGASAYLSKETASEVLCQTIDALIGERTRRRASQRLAETNGSSPASTILLIDGNAKDRQYFTDHLRTHSPDFQVLEAADGRSGLEIYQQRLQRIDCVVLELTLPDISAFEVLMKLVHRAQAPNVAVIVLATNPRRSLMELAMKNGAHACLDKSQTSGHELSAIIRKAVNTVEPMRK